RHRGTRSRRRSGRSPRRTGARSPRPTAPASTALHMKRDGVGGFDHVSLPMQETDAMVAFYRALGFEVAEQPSIVSVYVGDEMIILHRPEIWQKKGFTLGEPTASPPSGDVGF